MKTTTRFDNMTTSEKLNHLADWLEANVKPEQFNFDSWSNRPGYMAELKAPKCGTTACAAGYANMAFAGSGLQCWGTESRSWTSFSSRDLEGFLGMDEAPYERAFEHETLTDFVRLFMDGDKRLYRKYGLTIPLSAVIARIRRCAKFYAKRDSK